jgi:hypothetical protein
MKKYWVYFILVLLLAFYIRIQNFDQRVFIVGDSARDVLVARGSLDAKVLPPIASFSSAGPFVFGPQYYWLLMAVYAININHWPIYYYFLIFQAVAFVAIMMLTGKMMLNKKFSLILGLVAAVSYRQVLRSMLMTQHTIVGITAALALLFLIRFIKKKNFRSIFWCGFWISMGISMHYEAIGLLVFGLPIFFVGKNVKQKLINLAGYGAGLLIPMLPLLWWDRTQNFANTGNLLDYLLIGQYRIYIANRWLWHLFRFWPETAGDLFSGNRLIGGVALYGSFILGLIFLARKTLNIYLKYIFIIFLFYFIYLRFYRGEKFEGYLIYLHPIILMILGWGLFVLTKWKRLFFAAFFVVLIVASQNLTTALKIYNFNEYQRFEVIEKKLIIAAGGKTKFAVYDFADSRGMTDTWDVSDAFSAFFASRGVLDYKNGVKIGLCRTSCPGGSQTEIKDEFFDFYKDRMILVNKQDKVRLVERSPAAVTREIAFWWKERPLKTPFNLGKYILERIPIVNKIIKI